MRRLLTAKLIFALVLLINIPSALAVEGWEIPTFDIQITVNEDASILVEETIVADFTNEAHHGIFRYIPTTYKTKAGSVLRLRYDTIEVVDENGNEWWVQETTPGNNVNLKIGTPDRTWTEPVTYIIRYEINRAVNYFENHDELYWNSTGLDWPVPIHSTSTTINIPKGANAESLKHTCFTGAEFSQNQNCEIEVPDDSTIRYSYDQTLDPGEGMTVVAGWPNGLVSKPSQAEEFKYFFTDNFLYFIPLFFAIILLYLWYKKGRDPQGRGTIIPHYKPPEGLTPSEIGTLVDEKAHIEDVTVAIVDLAIRGYLQIDESKSKGLFKSTKTKLTKKKDFRNDDSLTEYEKEILEGIFGSGSELYIKDLKNKFYTHLPKIKDGIYLDLVEKGFFAKRPDKVRSLYMSLGIGLLFAAFWGVPFIAGIFSESYIGQLMFAFIGSAILLIIFSFVMPRKTKKGVKVVEHILGFKEFIKTAEKDRIKFFQELKDKADEEGDVKTFEKLLPFAIALGMGGIWSELFKDIYRQTGTQPTWYTGYNASTFNAIHLNDRLGNISKTASAAFTAKPSSASGGGSGFGGGGFSGGGFGGGGGGSW